MEREDGMEELLREDCREGLLREECSGGLRREACRLGLLSEDCREGLLRELCIGEGSPAGIRTERPCQQPQRPGEPGWAGPGRDGGSRTPHWGWGAVGG